MLVRIEEHNIFVSLILFHLFLLLHIFKFDNIEQARKVFYPFTKDSYETSQFPADVIEN